MAELLNVRVMREGSNDVVEIPGHAIAAFAPDGTGSEFRPHKSLVLEMYDPVPSKEIASLDLDASFNIVLAFGHDDVITKHFEITGYRPSIARGPWAMVALVFDLDDKPSAETQHSTPDPTVGGGDAWQHEHVVPEEPKPVEYEYRTTDGPRKGWYGEPDLSKEGWEEYKEWERFDYHEERYWRRPIVSETPPVSSGESPQEMEDRGMHIVIWFVGDIYRFCPLVASRSTTISIPIGWRFAPDPDHGVVLKNVFGSSISAWTAMHWAKKDESGFHVVKPTKGRTPCNAMSKDRS